MDQNKKIFSSSTLFYAILFVFSFSLLFAPQTAYGQEGHDWNSWEIIPSECLTKDGDCNLNSFVNLFVNLSYIMLKITPYLAMLMMIIGGFSLIVAGGKQERVQTGKRVITSVLLGTVIIIGLAWVLSFFVVSALTGDTDQESGKIFKGYSAIWEKEWWGGGESMVYPPGTGCCVVNDYGCEEMIEDDCNNLKSIYPDSDIFWQGENRFCDEYSAICLNYTQGCCVSIEALSGYEPGGCWWPHPEKGCIGLPTTVHNETACNFNGYCDQDTIKGNQEAGEPGEGTQGCCVQTDTCNMVDISDCPSGSNFQTGINCSDIGVCNTGCCVSQNSCFAGKINCEQGKIKGLYSTGDCQSGDCDTVCCIQDLGGNNNCYTHITTLWCNDVLNGEKDPFLSLPDCVAASGCFDGCCQDTCTQGNVDGSCAQYTYDANNNCDNNIYCVGICCIYQGATDCMDNVPKSQCQAPHQDLSGGGVIQPCSNYPECQTGCCVNSTDNTCIDSIIQQACWDSGGTGYYPESTCANATTLCDTGCCELPDGSCNDWNRMQCDDNSGEFTTGTTCNSLSDCSGCCADKSMGVPWICINNVNEFYCTNQGHIWETQPCSDFNECS